MNDTSDEDEIARLPLRHLIAFVLAVDRATDTLRAGQCSHLSALDRVTASLDKLRLADG